MLPACIVPERRYPPCQTDVEPRGRYVEVIFHSTLPSPQPTGFRLSQVTGQVITLFGQRLWMARDLLPLFHGFENITVTILQEADSIPCRR